MKKSVLILFLLIACLVSAQKAPWTFAVSGDSRNCGNVIMPAIAAGAHKGHAVFYLHLGDLRAIVFPDEDYQHEPDHRGQPAHTPEYVSQYLKDAWDDFIQNQIGPFGHMPFYVGIGNHETNKPKTREEFVAKFTRWLDTPTLKKQRLADNPQDQNPHSYFHWIQGGVDFISMDNATPDQFDPPQMAWFEDVLKRARTNDEVKTVVVGMHQALPDSLAAGHSMNDFLVGAQTGRQVYGDLLRFNQETKKHVYILASHAHFYMSGIFDSDYWNQHGGVLPGWIVGTGGAMRYPLPPDSTRAQEARQKVYGYLLGTVQRDGSIGFEFHEVNRGDVLSSVVKHYTPEFTDYCFDGNTDFKPHVLPAEK